MAARQDSTTSYVALAFVLLLAGSSLIAPIAAAQGNAATGTVPTSGERLAITPDQRLALVANSLDWVKDGEDWRGIPDTKIFVIDLTASPPC